MSQRRRNQRTQIDEELAELEAAEAAEAHARTLAGDRVRADGTGPSAEVKRLKLGWKIRVDLKKACQQIALDTDRKDYEVLEMLLEEALAARAMVQREK